MANMVGVHSFAMQMPVLWMSVCLSRHFFFFSAGSNSYSINFVFKMEGNHFGNPLGRGLLLKFYPPSTQLKLVISEMFHKAFCTAAGGGSVRKLSLSGYHGTAPSRAEGQDC